MKKSRTILPERIIGALTFRQGVFAEVKKDLGFTGSAWVIIFITSFLCALGSNTSLIRSGRVINWLLGVIGTALFLVVGFILACLALQWLVKYFFNTSANFQELVRPSGLAFIWMAITCVGILTVPLPGIGCVTGLVGLAAVILWFFDWIIAIKETLGLEWVQSVSAAIIGLLVIIGVSFISNTVLGLFGLVGNSIISIFG
jgi:hypothetical protein